MKYEKLLYGIGNILWILSLCLPALPAHRFAVSVLMCCGAALYIFCAWKSGNRAAMTMIMPAVSLVSAAGYAVCGSGFFFRAADISAFITGSTEMFMYFRKSSWIWKKTYPSLRIQYVMRVLQLLLFWSLWGMLAVSECRPEAFVRRMTEIRENRSVYPVPSQEDSPEGILYRDIAYGETYPESICDIRIRTDEQPYGTVIWIHGGDCINGDKNEDNASQKLYANCLYEGYAAVAMNYVSAPEYTFPVPLKQLDALLCFLQENNAYGLNTERIVLAGTGSGADIAVQYLTAAKNPEYADNIGFAPSADSSRIAGAYLLSALYTPQKGAETDLILTDYTAYQQLRLYYGTDDLNDPRIKKADVLPYITEDFPLLLVGDGNTGTYHRQAHRMEEKAESLGVLYVSCIYDDPGDDRELLYRSFDTGYTSYANAVRSRFLDLLEELKKP